MHRGLIGLAARLCLTGATMSCAFAQSWPVTRAERTGYLETSHYEDVVSFLHNLQLAGAPVTIESMGKSTDGREMPLAIASFPRVSSAAEARRLGRPIVYVQANIHAGEVEGKEAILAILSRLSKDGSKGLLGKIVLLVAPIYNLDGNEKFGPVERNRPEQDGPALVGVRANGQGLDLNRDAIKAESPETRGVLEHVYNSWDPDVMMDLHTTDGTRHGWELTYAPPMNPNTDQDVMHFTRDILLPSVRKQLSNKFGMLTFDYGNVEKRGEQPRAWYSYGQEARYCTHYAGLRGRIAILSEATTFIPFKDRVVGTDRFVTSILEYVAAHGKQVIDLTRQADARIVNWGLNVQSAPELGVRFGFESRGDEVVLLEHLAPGTPPSLGRPKELDKVKMPIFDRFKVTRTSRLPSAYLIPNGMRDSIELLKRHGILVEKLLTNWSGPCEQFEVDSLNTAGSAFQGHKLVSLNGTFHKLDGQAGQGWYIVRTAQPLGRLAFHLLEPESLDGVVAWGFVGNEIKAKQPYPILKTFDEIKVATVREMASQ